VLDANEDSLPDLAVTDMKENQLHVLLGNLGGEFKRAKDSPTEAGNEPGEIVAADFNRDGHADCAIANHDVPYVTILLGDGAGGFAPSPASPVTVRNDPHPHTIQAADINSDSITDLIIDSPNDHAVLVLYGDGDGGFAAADAMVPVGGKPYHTIAVGDLNSDGLADLITPNERAICVFLGNGQGAFMMADGSPLLESDPFSVAIGNFNADAFYDVAKGGGERIGSISVWYGNGTGHLASPPESPFEGGLGASIVATGDIDGDGCDDICCTHYLGDNVTVLLGSRDRIAPAPDSPISVGDAPYGIAVSDLNGDGKAEIIVGHYDSGFVSILRTQ
jgi:hypothetical protein